MNLPLLVLLAIGGQLGPHVGPFIGSGKAPSPVVGHSVAGDYHLGARDWYGAPSPTVACQPILTANRCSSDGGGWGGGTIIGLTPVGNTGVCDVPAATAGGSVLIEIGGQKIVRNFTTYDQEFIILTEALPSVSDSMIFTFYGISCSGATPSPQGGPDTVGTPLYPDGYAAAVAAGDTSVGQTKALRFDGSADYVLLGDVADTTTDLATCVWFRPANTSAGTRFIVGKTNNATGWGIYQSGTSVRWWVTKAGGAYTDYVFGTVVANAWYEACVSYQYVADGTSVMRAGLNAGTQYANSTSVGPLENTSHSLAIGAAATGAAKFVGDIGPVTVWAGPGSSFTETSLDVASASQLGLVGKGGYREPFARADVGTVAPVLDAEIYYVGAGIPETDRRGMWHGGAAKNDTAYSDTASWVAQAAGVTTAALSANYAAAPDGTMTADKWTFPAVVSAGQFSVIGSTDPLVYDTSTWTHAVWGRTESGTATVYIYVYLGSYAGVTPCTFTTTWSRCVSTAAMGNSTANWFIGFDFNGGMANAAPVSVILAQAQRTNTAGTRPFRATTGSRYSGPATTHQGKPPRTDAETWVNLLKQSEDFSTTWAIACNPGSGSVTANAAVAPDGSFTADKVTIAAVGTGQYCVVQQTGAGWTALPGTAAGAAAAGVWLKAGTLANPAVCIYDGVSYKASSTCDLSDGEWHWCPTYGTAAAGWYVDIGRATSAGNCGGTTSGGTFYVWGGQAEQGVTSLHPYCPTTTYAATCGTSGGLGKTVVNLLTNNETYASGWTKDAGVTVTEQSASCPLDPNTGQRMALWTFPQNLYGGYRSVATGLARSGWFANATGDSACNVRFTEPNATPATDCAVTSTPTRCAHYTASGTGLLVAKSNSSGCAQVCTSSLQVENATSAGRYCGPTGASSKTCTFVERPAQPWAVSVTATTATAPLNNNYFVSLGTGSEANFAYLSGYYYGLYDWQLVQRYLTFAPSNIETGTHTHLISASGDGTMIFSEDGVARNLSFSGSGLGVFSKAPTSLLLGYNVSGNYLNGWIKSYATCTKTGGCR